MAVSFGFYNSVNHDRKYNSEQISRIFDGVIQDGVYLSIGNQFALSPAVNLQVIVKSGRCWFNHTWLYNDSDLYLSLNTADPFLKRIDAIIIEVDATPTVRKSAIKIVQGTPSSGGTKPTLTNTALIHQYAIGYVTVNGGATSISAADIEYTVGKEPCPYVTSVLEKTDITPVWNQWKAQFDQIIAQKASAFDTMQTQKASGFDIMQTNKASAFDTMQTDRESAFNTMMEEDDAEFQEWFANLKLQLTEDVVTNLQNQINQLGIDKVNVADLATTDEAKAGTDNTKWMTPLRTHEHYLANKATSATDTNTNHWTTNSYVSSKINSYGKGLVSDKKLFGYSLLYIPYEPVIHDVEKTVRIVFNQSNAILYFYPLNTNISVSYSIAAWTLGDNRLIMFISNGIISGALRPSLLYLNDGKETYIPLLNNIYPFQSSVPYNISISPLTLIATNASLINGKNITDQFFFIIKGSGTYIYALSLSDGSFESIGIGNLSTSSSNVLLSNGGLANPIILHRDDSIAFRIDSISISTTAINNRWDLTIKLAYYTGSNSSTSLSLVTTAYDTDPSKKGIITSGYSYVSNASVVHAFENCIYGDLSIATFMTLNVSYDTSSIYFTSLKVDIHAASTINSLGSTAQVHRTSVSISKLGRNTNRVGLNHQTWFGRFVMLGSYAAFVRVYSGNSSFDIYEIEASLLDDFIDATSNSYNKCLWSKGNGAYADYFVTPTRIYPMIICYPYQDNQRPMAINPYAKRIIFWFSNNKRKLFATVDAGFHNSTNDNGTYTIPFLSQHAIAENDGAYISIFGFGNKIEIGHSSRDTRVRFLDNIGLMDKSAALKQYRPKMEYYIIPDLNPNHLTDINFRDNNSQLSVKYSDLSTTSIVFGVGSRYMCDISLGSIKVYRYDLEKNMLYEIE